MLNLGKILNKKAIFIFIIILILGAGGFFWWQNQEDVRALNKNLPKGVKVEKSLIGNEYKVVNKIDGYEFKVPKEWRGVEQIKYVQERIEEKYVLSSIELEGQEGAGRIIGINHFKLQDSTENLEEWAKTSLDFSGLTNNLTKEKIGQFDVVKTQESIGFVGYIYFFQKNPVIYTITGGSEEFIREIISNGKW